MSNYDPQQWGARCDVCILRAQGAVVIPPHIPYNFAATVMLIGEAPGMQEVKGGQVFIGPSGVKLNDMLRISGLPPRAQLWISNTLLCRPDLARASGFGAEEAIGRKRFEVKNYVAWLRKENARRKKAKEPVIPSPFDCCYPRLQREMSQVEANAIACNKPNGAVIMPMGNFALCAVLGEPGKAKGIMKYRGSVIQPERKNI